jgi:antitoxin ParD1/3/4
MNIRLGDRWQPLIDQAVRSGRFTSAEDVVAEAMRLLEARERDSIELRASIEAALADPQIVSEAEIDSAIEEEIAQLRSEGYP